MGGATRFGCITAPVAGCPLCNRGRSTSGRGVIFEFGHASHHDWLGRSSPAPSLHDWLVGHAQDEVESAKPPIHGARSYGSEPISVKDSAAFACATEGLPASTWRRINRWTAPLLRPYNARVVITGSVAPNVDPNVDRIRIVRLDVFPRGPRNCTACPRPHGLNGALSDSAAIQAVLAPRMRD